MAEAKWSAAAVKAHCNPKVPNRALVAQNDKETPHQLSPIQAGLWVRWEAGRLVELVELFHTPPLLLQAQDPSHEPAHGRETAINGRLVMQHGFSASHSDR
jgi:hypothetical protein